MSIRTKIDFSGITSDNIVTSDNKKYIREDDEIFNSLKDEIAACENAQVQTEIATLEILDIKEQTKVIANEAIDAATERAESAAERAETAQALAESAAINALEAERNVTEFSENFAKLDEDNTFTGNNNFTGTLSLNNKSVLTADDLSNYVTNDTLSNKNYLTSSALTDYAKKTDLNSYATTASLSSYLKSSDIKGYISSSNKSSNNWYIKYSNGLILQGGTLSITSNITTITFPTPFSSIPSIYLSRATTRGQGSWDSELYPYSISKSNFTYKMNTTEVSNATWFAIGY
jgi:hypothetical protein